MVIGCSPKLSVPSVVVLVVAVLSPFATTVTAATHVADVVPATVHVSDTSSLTLPVTPATPPVGADSMIVVVHAKVLLPSVIRTCVGGDVRVRNARGGGEITYAFSGYASGGAGGTGYVVGC
jgi:hypothetical protein